MNVVRHVALRALLGIPLLIGVTFVTFIMLFSIGDPAAAVAGEFATPQDVADTKVRLGLDRPVVEQYVDWVSDVVRGDFGQSFSSDRPVWDMIGERLSVSLSLAGLTMLVAVLVAVVAGFAAGRRPGGAVDVVVRSGSILGQAIPNFFFGFMMVLIFAVWLGWFPSLGYRPIADGVWPWLERIILPSVTLGLAFSAEQVRTFRASILREMGSDYVRTARAKNVPERRIVLAHAGRNGALPLVTVIGLQCGMVLASAVLVERVFSLPGLGGLAVDATLKKDVPVVQALVCLTAIVVVVASLLVDLAYGVLNPATRAES